MSDATATDPFAPPAEPTRPRPWYRRRAFLLVAVVVIVLVVTVLTDLPQSASRGVQVSDDTSIMKQVNADVQGCAYGLSKEVFPIYEDEVRNDLAPSERALVPGLLRDDQSACSFTNQDIYDLSNIEVPGGPTGKYLQRLVGTITTWVTSDALAAIDAIQTLWTSPHDAKALQDLAKAERELHADRVICLTDVADVDHALHTHLPAPDVPAVPYLQSARSG